MEMTKELAELTGIMCGDGCLSSCNGAYVTYICGHKIDDREYHEETIKSLFLKLFGKQVYIKERKKENAIFIRSYDRNIFNYLHSIGIPIGKKYSLLKIPLIIKENPDFALSFMRGLADTDGSIIFSKQHRNVGYYPRIEIASKSEAFLREALAILTSNGFYGSVSKKWIHYRLEIPGFKNLQRWLKLIGFNNKKHIRKIWAHMGPITPSTRLELVIS